MSLPSNTQSGFTLVELIVSVSIFVFMTSFLVGKFGTFNQAILVTNTAYDVALTIRNAQSYAMNVRQSSVDTAALTSFQHPYGVHFAAGSNTFFFFSDTSNNNAYSTDEIITTSTIKKGLVISEIRAQCGTLGFDPKAAADVSFRRPDPDAILMTRAALPDAPIKCETLKLIVRAPDGSTKVVTIRSTGQIAIED